MSVPRQPNELDARDGIHSIWITATKDDKVLTIDALRPYLATAFAVTTDSLFDASVVMRAGVPAIRLHGNKTERNDALLALRQAFYAAGAKWLQSEDFNWLKTHGLAKPDRRS